MELLILRHGEAIEDSPPGLGDDGRWLTGKGRTITRGVAGYLAASPRGRPAQVWSSPLVRAVQTAEIVSEACALTDELSVLEALSTRGSPREVLRRAGRYTGPGPLMLVGHEPGLSMLVTELLGPAVPFTGFKKSGLVALRWEGGASGSGVFLWALEPRTLTVLTEPAALGRS